MTRDRLKFNWAMNIIDYKIISKPHLSGEPTRGQLEAIGIALQAMRQQAKETDANLHRHMAILEYHIKNPGAVLCRDRYTVDALTAGILAMKWMINRAEDGEEHEDEEHSE